MWPSQEEEVLSCGADSARQAKGCWTGQALGLFLNEWGRRDGPFHSETLGGERVSPAPISSTLAS